MTDTVALCLSGGGSRGDFEVGAVRCLYERNLLPDIITGTSAGSINAAKLAEGGKRSAGGTTVDDRMDALIALESLWRELKTDRDMWNYEPWLEHIEHPKIVELFESGFLPAMGAAALAVPVLAWIPLLIAAVAAGIALEDLHDALDKASRARSLGNLGPISDRLHQQRYLDPGKVKQSGTKLRLAMVGLESGSLRYVTQAGELLERAGSQIQAMPVLAPECRATDAQIKEAERTRLRLQGELAQASGPEKAELLAQIREVNQQIGQLKTQLADCKRLHPPPPRAAVVTLPDAVLASASIPVSFPPQKLPGDPTGENYVDGGVREIVPIDAAIQAGANRVYAVVASSSRLDPPVDFLDETRPIASFDSENFVNIAGRSAGEIMSNETALNEIDPPSGPWRRKRPNADTWDIVDVTVIQPIADLRNLHDIKTIDPGLIAIQMAYGYMRADDVLQAKRAAPAGYRNLADTYSRDRRTVEIVLQRFAIWEYENGIGAQPDDSALEGLRNLKRQLQTLVEQRRQAGGALPNAPDTLQSWWRDWERHQWQPARPLWPPKTMRVTIAPARLTLGHAVAVTVSATDATDGSTVAGSVVVDGAQVGATGTPFTFTFETHTEMHTDPRTHEHTEVEVPPKGRVEADGFVPANIPLVFDRAVVPG